MGGLTVALRQIIFSIILAFFVRQPFVLTDRCNFHKCHEVQPGKLNIHLVPHTHDDAGWLKTVDQYFYGGKNVHAPFAVQHIIDSVISELETSEDRRFIYVESSFLWRWWIERGEKEHDRMIKLVKEGRLELVHGGWVMSDEATPHYSSLIDQMSFGLKFLQEKFGFCARPDVAWQIDAFGHSSEIALEFAQMAFEGVFFGRIDQKDYNKRKDNRTLELVWRPDVNKGEEGELFTGILYNLYFPPDGYCFDAFCNDEPIMDNPKLHGYNVETRVHNFVYSSRTWAQSYNTNNILVPMGGDFHYMVAGSWFMNMDKLMRYANKKYSDVHLLYSTPYCYLKALNEANKTWPVKDNTDFFPYSSYEGRYWTGYYTSRPTLKFMTYRTNNLLQVVKKMSAEFGELVKDEMFTIEQAVALLQHHDAVSGTEKQHVADDYALYLEEANSAGAVIVSSAYRKWLGIDYAQQIFCPLVNISSCEISEQMDDFVINVFNPLSRFVNMTIRVPVTASQFVVVGESNVPGIGTINYELMPLPPQVENIPGRKSQAKHDLVFMAYNIPPIGMKSFFVQPFNDTDVPFSLQTSSSEEISDEVVVYIEEELKIVMNGTTGLLQYIIIDNETFYLHQNFHYYFNSLYYSPSRPSFNLKSSGAYTFSSSSFSPTVITNKATFTVHKGQNVIEIHQTFNDWVSQIIRLYKGKSYVEFNWLVGPIDMRTRTSMEVITRYETNLATNKKFYTDSNGRRFIERESDWAEKLHGDDTAVGRNYYPVTTAARICDQQASLTVLTDRPQAATSLMKGQLEFLLHRRLMTDDYKGVIEPLNEEQFRTGLVARGTHTLYFIKNSLGKRPLAKASHLHRLNAMEISYAPWVSLSTVQFPRAEWMSKFQMQLQPILAYPLRDNVNILTMEYHSHGRLLIRLEHIFESKEHPFLSKPVTISFKGMFKNLQVISATRMTLDGNAVKDLVPRMAWQLEKPTKIINDTPTDPITLSFLLRPMQIETFVLSYNKI